jgi:hypothetical protein
MRTERVTCDGCGADLTTRTNMVDYRLVLASESKPGHGEGFYTAMGIYPTINRAHHFCGLACLDLWRDRERHSNKLVGANFNKWRAAHETVHPGGMRSYTEPPEETRKAWCDEARAAALEAYPLETASR